jgi:hypothetical protein
VCVLVPGTQKGEVSNLHRFSGTYKVELGQDGVADDAFTAKFSGA